VDRYIGNQGHMLVQYDISAQLYETFAMAVVDLSSSSRTGMDGPCSRALGRR